MEELLIARVVPIMQVRYTKGGQLRYKDHIVNFPQDISVIASSLPRLPEDVDMVVIRCESAELDNHIDFIVRREKVLLALQYKKMHDPHYADVIIDHAALSQLPESGSVAARIRTCRVGRQQQDAPQAAGPTEAAGDGGLGEDHEHGEEHTPTVGGVLNINQPHVTEIQAVRSRVTEVLQGVSAQEPVIVSTRQSVQT